VSYVFLVEHREPSAHGGAQLIDLQATVLCGKGIKLFEARTQE
jgi:hypothetical protein